jgi:hypothetical protein
MFPDYDQPKTGRKLIDAGADLIIGHHSHTFQPYEVYQGKCIFYSLGNFCFSDFECEGKRSFMHRSRRITGLVHVNFSKNEYKLDKIRFFENVMTDFIPLNRYHFRSSLRNFYFKHILKYLTAWFCYYFMQKKILPLYHFLIRPDLRLLEKFLRLKNAFLKRVNNR